MKQKLIAIWNWLRANQTVWFALFILVYAIAWTLNAVMQTKFVLKEWEDLGKYVLGKYGTDSLLNSPIPWTGKKEDK